MAGRKTKFELGEDVTPELELKLDSSAYSIVYTDGLWKVIQISFDKTLMLPSEEFKVIYETDSKQEAGEHFKITVATTLL